MVKIFKVVFAKVDAIEQNLAFGRVVKAGDQFDDGRLALAVFPDQRNAFAGMPGVKLKLLKTRRVAPG